MKNLDHEFYQYLLKYVELSPEEIRLASPNEILDQLLAYEGFGQYAGYMIRHMIRKIYGVNLDDLSLNAMLEGGADHE